jgi:acetyltransferase-like isoleucine patch superfamily enzyme
MHQRKPMEDPLSWLPRIVTKLHSLWLSATYPFASVGRNLSVHYTCEVKRSIANQIWLGDSVYIAKDAWLNVAVSSQSQGPVIILDDRCVIARRSMISGKNRIHLEHNVILSASVLIMDHAHAYEDVSLPIEQQGVTEGGTIRVEEGCWIGQGAAIVCNGGELVIGRNSVIAANALVTKSVPAFSVVSGNPARVVKQYDVAKQKWVLGSVRQSSAEFTEQGGMGSPASAVAAPVFSVQE